MVVTKYLDSPMTSKKHVLDSIEKTKYNTNLIEILSFSKIVQKSEILVFCRFIAKKFV